MKKNGKKLGGDRYYTFMQPDRYIHLYWIDETGKENMMMRIDYPMIENLKKDGWAYYKGYFIGVRASQSIAESPENIGEWFANGFLM